MLARNFRPTSDPQPARDEFHASDLLDRSNDQVATVIHSCQRDNPALKRVSQIRRAGLPVTELVDRLPAPADSLPEHLSKQLRLGPHSPRLRALAEWIIGNLDPHGYLRDELADLAAMVDATTADAEQALAIVQALEPTGVGARSFEECLLLQLRAQADADPLALRLVEGGYLVALSEHRYDGLTQILGQPRERILSALAQIRRLEPRPGRSFGDATVQTVRPDVAIEKCDEGGYRVVMRDDEMPSLRVSRQRWAEAAAANGEARRYLASRLNEASQLLTAIERRRETVRGVVESIVRRQPDFLEHGPDRLRPLLLRQVADDVGVHESTVSRAVAHRYVDTPHGILPLRVFFTNRLPGDPAGIVSSSTARLRIRETVAAEDPSRPLADGQIVRVLETAGIRIARRTVVKYREQLGIASAPARRSSSA